ATMLVLIKLKPDQTLIFTRLHHLQIDGVGLASLHQLLHRVYRCLQSGESTQWLQQLPQYRPVVAKTQDWLTSEQYQRSEAYWCDFYSHRQQYRLARHSYEKSSHEEKSHNKDISALHCVELTPLLTESLNGFCRDHRVSPLVLLGAVAGCYFSRISDLQEVVMSTAVHGRDPGDAMTVVGMHSNVIALACKVTDDMDFLGLTAELKSNLAQGRDHRQFPTSHLVRALGDNEVSKADVQVIFDAQAEDSEHSNGLVTSLHNVQPLQIRLVQPYGDGCFRLKVICDRRYFSATEQQMLSERLIYILQQGLADSNKPLAQIAIVPEHERQLLLSRSDAPDAHSSQGTSQNLSQVTLTQLFAEQAAKTPDNIALMFGDKSLSYCQLDDQVNQLAQVILSQTTIAQQSGDTFVALYFDRSIEMVIAILAVLKAGAAYVPIAPEYPKARVEFILSDTGANLLLTHGDYQQDLAQWNTAVKIINIDLDQTVTGQMPTPANSPNDLAYVIYTSGTTGQPKGVMIEHHSEVNLIASQHRTFDFTEQERAIWLASYTFDAAVEQLFLPLFCGGSLYIPSIEQVKDEAQIKAIICHQEITHLHATPGYLAALGAIEAPHSLRRVISGGDVPSTLLKQIWGDKLINEYGPTETTVTAVQSVDYHLQGSIHCIGKPVGQSRLYVLDGNRQLVPIGAAGELYIGGAGVARGYLNRAELTAQCFIANPYLTGDRLYKTGDLVRWLDDGSLQYLGRNDAQLKIRGFRIEPGEIEHALCQLPTIRQAVVVAVEVKGEKRLAAYLVAQNDQQINTDEMPQALAATLPDYMVPASFTVIDKIPLTVNGKLDVKALPSVEFVDTSAYVAPQDELEQQLCNIWQDILGLDRVGSSDSFFRIGGNSISAMRMAATVRREMSFDVPLELLFDRPTVARLAGSFRENSREKSRENDNSSQLHIPHVEQNNYPLSFAQQRLWFIEQFEQGSNAYHIPYMIKVGDCDLTMLTAAINVVAKRHPVLNCVYANDVQTPLETELAVITHTDLKAAIEQPFDLSAEPALKLIHFYRNEQQGNLLLLFHHIAFDGWSLDIFNHELAQAYKGEYLQPLEINYGDYARWQREYLTGQTRARLLDYWQQQLSGCETLTLPTDYARPARPDYRGADVTFTLDETVSKQLRELAKAQQTTVYTVLLSGFYVALAAQSGQTDIVVGTPSDNRQHHQSQQLIGFFVNSLALRAQLEQSQTIETLIEQVHQVVVQGKVHQELPFEQLLDVLDVERDSSRHPLFGVMFSVQDFGSEGLFESVDLSDVYSPAKFDLSVAIDDSQAQLVANFNYALSLFKHQRIERMAKMYQQILHAFVDSVEQPLFQVEVLMTDERAMLLARACGIDANKAVAPTTLAQLFAIQVNKTPNNIALVFGQQQLSYDELNQRAEQLAVVICDHHQLRHGQALAADTLIGLYFDRSIDMVVSILAVHKAGGAYVPMAVDAPRQRIEYILGDTGVTQILTQSHYCQRLRQWAADEFEVVASDALENIPVIKTTRAQPQANALAYVIYTSGTTGQPKGVMIEHQSISQLIISQTKTLNFARDEKVIWLPSYVFDASVETLFMTLINGGKLIVPSEAELQSAEAISAQIEQHQVTHLVAAASYLRTLGDLSHITSIKRVVSGGEMCPVELKKHWGSLLINQYGPTETTVSAVQCLDYSDQSSLSCIGTAVGQSQLYVLDQQLNLVPLGTPGELYIGGGGLARGYLNQAQLTAERFISHAFAGSDSPVRLYKTGDKVRWLAPGQLEYLGRNDHQVKIRGYRIELNEIEAQLGHIKSVAQAVVVANEHKGKPTLAAYVVTQNGHQFDSKQL
ncbi:MAG: amino acid adenylation domain-containing protein, partial [Psychrosphaera sp.]|nr:amino acid adenylation domain-containing protein [Psychrosphaera sp.]